MRSDILTVIGLAASFVFVVLQAGAQVFLNADGQSDTYTLINQTLGGTAEETPDCSHPDFGPVVRKKYSQWSGMPFLTPQFSPADIRDAAHQEWM